MTAKSLRIDALRGGAALSVLVYHCVSFFLFGRWLDFPAPLRKFAEYGWAGVDVFFVLSAFLLARNLLKHRGEDGVVANFYRRRMLRVLPMYLVMLSAAFALFALLGDGWLFKGLAPPWVYLTFTQNFWTGFNASFDGQFLSPTWSLAVEEHFYLFLPLLILRLTDRSILWAALALILLTPILRYAVSNEYGPIAAYTWTFCRLDSFGWGLLVAVAPRLSPALRERIVIAWIAAAIWIVLRISLTGLGDLTDPLSVTTVTLFAAGAVAMVVESDVRTGAKTGALVRVLAYFGERCFSIYLLHIPVAGLSALAFGLAVPKVYDPIAAAALITAIPATLGLAALTYRFIERPFIEYGEKIAAYGRNAAPASA